MTERFDVIVVGAGPAGSSAARYAALGGARTLLLEAKATIGIPVQCGELLAEPAEMEPVFGADYDYEEFLAIPDHQKVHRTTSISIRTPGGMKYRFPFRAFTLDRSAFDPFLASQAEVAGAELRLSSRVRKVRDREVILRDGSTISGRVIIGADEPRSTVARAVGLPGNGRLTPAYTTQVEGGFGNECQMLFGAMAPGGYAWIFPKGKKANVGLGFDPKMTGGKARNGAAGRRLLQRFTKQRGLAAGPITGGLIPMDGPLERTVLGRVMLVGDAAGQVMATNGGGIPLGMAAGRMAGSLAARFHHRGTGWQRYERDWRRRFQEPLLVARRIKRLSRLGARSDLLTGLMMRLAGRRGLENAMRCKPIFGVI